MGNIDVNNLYLKENDDMHTLDYNPSHNKEIKVKLLRDNARIPTIATTGSAAYDLYVSAFITEDGKYITDDTVIKLSKDHTTCLKCATGIAVEIPEGYCALILPRSGLAIKENITVSNSPGLIDSDYRGEIIVGLIKHHTYNNSKDSYIHIGDRVAQMLIVKYNEFALNEVNELSSTYRGENGFGSTGNS